MKKNYLIKSYFLILMAIFPLFCYSAGADIIITAININPPGIDTGYEWVELYNPTNQTLSLQSYSLEKGNGANEDDWNQIWQGPSNSFLPPYSYYLLAEDKVNFSVDETLSLRIENGPDGIRVLKTNQILETIGWGDLEYPEYYETQPLPKPVNSEIFVRKHELTNKILLYNKTGNNFNDFYLTNSYFPQSLSGSKKIIISFEVSQDYLNFKNINFTDDDIYSGGYQVSHSPSQVREINFTIFLNYSNDCDSLQTHEYEFNGVVHPLTLIDSNNSCRFTGEIKLNYTLLPDNYSINFTFSDKNNLTNSTLLEFEYLPMISFSMDSFHLDFQDISKSTENILLGDLDFSTKQNPTIKNTGNTILDFAVYSNGFNSETNLISKESLHYCFGLDCSTEDFIAINSDLNPVNLNLGIGENAPLSFMLKVPSNSSGGKYIGEVGLMVLGN